MRSRRIHVAVVLATCAPLALASQSKLAPVTQPTPDSLAAITNRGRVLAWYDFIAWHGTDAVFNGRPPDTAYVQGYIVRQMPSGWVAVFGRLSADSNTYLVSYEARQTARPDSFATSHYAPARRDTGYFVYAARALDLARARFGRPTRPYNAAVFPSGVGPWWVYLYPAQNTSGVFPLGGDVRYRVSDDGRRLLAQRRLHNTIIEFPPEKPDSAHTLEAGVHTAVLDNIPEDTDVFHVLAREPKVAQYVVSDAFVYRLEVDGTIRFLGRSENVLRR